LVNPGLGTVLRHIVLVVFVAHKSYELSISLGLRVLVVVSLSGGESVHFASLLYELVVKLTGGIAVVVSVRFLIPTAENSNLLSDKVEVGKSVVEPVVPGGSRALLVSSCMPSRGTYNKCVGSGDFINRSISDIVGLKSTGFSDVTGNSFGVSSRSGIPKRSHIKDGGLSERSVGDWGPRFGGGNSGKGDGERKLHF